MNTPLRIASTDRTDRFTDNEGRFSAITTTRMESGAFRATVTAGHGYGLVGYAPCLLAAISTVSALIDTLDAED